MPTKSNDRLAEIRARVARRAAPDPPNSPEAADGAQTDDAALAAANAHFLGVTERIIRNKMVERIPVGHIAPDLRPEMRQPRLLPPLEELFIQGKPAPAYRDLADELIALGQSLRERQIQPIIVYPGASDSYPAARYLILVGHRRWYAAMLSGIEMLDAIVVDPPEMADRVRVQYAENEAREEFSDMERAWALTQMKRALGDAPWDAVEAQFGISRSRRHELTRLLAFTPEQQRQVALLRMQETQVRSLHSAVRASDLTVAQVDQILGRLSEIAAERRSMTPAGATGEAGASRPTPRRAGIDGPTIARLVARAQRAAGADAKPSAPRWLPPLRDQLASASRGIQRAQERIATLDAADAAALLEDIERLTAHLALVTATLLQRQGETVHESD